MTSGGKIPPIIDALNYYDISIHPGENELTPVPFGSPILFLDGLRVLPGMPEAAAARLTAHDRPGTIRFRSTPAPLDEF
jgi:hypothetical protein